MPRGQGASFEMTTSRTPLLSFTARRIVVGLTLLIALLSAGNYLLGWGIAGPYEKKVMVACYVVLALACLLYLPTKAEWDAHRARKE
jgi:hypothetical protein